MSKAGLLISSKNQEMAIDKKKKRINKLQYIHEMEYYTAIQKKKGRITNK